VVPGDADEVPDQRLAIMIGSIDSKRWYQWRH
jgi:hypothetical protein